MSLSFEMESQWISFLVCKQTVVKIEVAALQKYVRKILHLVNIKMLSESNEVSIIDNVAFVHHL